MACAEVVVLEDGTGKEREGESDKSPGGFIKGEIEEIWTNQSIPSENSRRGEARATFVPPC